MDHQSPPYSIVQNPPILNIPEEIIVELFHWTIDEQKPATNILRLRQVCKKWMLILDSAPLLWRRITAADGLSNVRIALRKTGQALIDVVYTSNDCKVSPEIFLEEVEHKILQWRSLDIELPPGHTKSICPGLQTTVIPSLERLRLYRNPYTMSRATEIQLFGGAPAPASLAQVSICRMAVALEPLRLANLSSLALRSIPGLSVTELWRIMEQSPDLASLALQDLEDLQMDMRAPLNPIRMKSMKYLILELPVSVTHLLLSNIRAQLLTDLDITSEVTDSPIQSSLLTPRIAHLIPSLESIVSRTNIMVLEFQQDEISIKAGGLSLELGTAGEVGGMGIYACMRQAIEWLTENVGSYLATVPTRLHFNDVNPHSQDVWFFSITLRVVELSLYDHDWFANVPTQLLSDLGPPAPPFSQWLFPDLEVIHFDLGDVYHSRLVQTLQRRYGASSPTSGSGADAEAPQHPLRPLREIRFYGGRGFAYAPKRSVEFLKMVETQVPTATLFWRGELVLMAN